MERFEGWLRDSGGLTPIAQLNGWRSPRLGVTFHLRNGGLELRHPDGHPFAELWEVVNERNEERARAQQESKRAQREAERAERLAAKLRAMGVDPEV